MKRILAALIIALALPAHAQGSRGAPDIRPGPLQDILARIPADASGLIYLNDLAAARRQVDPLTTDAPTDLDRALAPMSSAFLPAALDQNSLLYFPDGGKEALGFSVFELDQIAGWGAPPQAPLVATGIDRHGDAIAERLRARGFAATPTQGHTVWHLQDDFKIDIARRNDDPLTGPLGQSQRIVVDGDTLLFARGWPVMNDLLDPGATLATEPDTAAILRAGYALRGAGDLLGAVIVPFPPSGRLDPGILLQSGGNMKPEQFALLLDRMPGRDLPGLPPFLRYGLLLWQDGYDTTGAIVIPYMSRDTAETARDRFTALLDVVESPAARRSFAELLPYDRRFEIVGTEARAVLVLGFTTSADATAPVSLTTFTNTPRRRLMDMLLLREIDLLIGAGP